MIEDILHEADYPQSPEQVWEALTRPDCLGAWLMENTFERPEVGHRFRFTDRPRPFWDGICECEVAEADPARRLVLTWAIDQRGTPSTVSWTLTERPEGGTHIVAWWMARDGWNDDATVQLRLMTARARATGLLAR